MSAPETDTFLVRVVAVAQGSPKPASHTLPTHSLLVACPRDRVVTQRSYAFQAAADVLDTLDVYPIDATAAPNLAIVGPLIATSGGEVVHEDALPVAPPAGEPVPVGWCHVCNRDIEAVGDHAPGCEVSDRGPDHPEIRPMPDDPAEEKAASERRAETVALLELLAERETDLGGKGYTLGMRDRARDGEDLGERYLAQLRAALVPEGCTGYPVTSGPARGSVHHDGDTCPVHEDTGAVPGASV